MVQYFERDQFVGERRAYCGGVSTPSGGHHSAYWPHTAYFCPSCGEIWARAINQFEFDYEPLVPGSWVTEQRRCVECGDGYLLVGQELHLDHVSPELIQREFALLISRS